MTHLFKERFALLPVVVLLLSMACQRAERRTDLIELSLNQEFTAGIFALSVLDVQPASGAASGIRFEKEAKTRKVSTYAVTMSIKNMTGDTIEVVGADLVTYDPSGLMVWNLDSRFEDGPLNLPPGEACEFTRKVNSTKRKEVAFSVAVDKAEGEKVLAGPFRLRL